MKKNILLYGLVLSVLLLSVKANATIRYVKPAATGTGTGANWVNASGDLQAMISASVSGDEVWVMQGTYLPTRLATTGAVSANNSGDAFVLKAGVSVYGGFAGTEIFRSSRNYTSNVTTLSGDIGAALTKTDNCYHVVIAAGPISGDGLMDGFTISNGYADAATAVTVNAQTNAVVNNRGGGVYITNASPTIQNCIIKSNEALNGTGGAGIFSGSNASPTINNCTVNSNITTGATSNGAGMYIASSATTISNCTISSNTSSVEGGGIYIASTGVVAVSNDDVTSNTASVDGGGISNYSSAVSIVSCVFTSNSSPLGGGLYNQNASPVVSSCSFLSNTSTTGGAGIRNYSTASPTVQYCIFSGNAGGTFGGGIYNSTSSAPAVTSCLFSGNTAANGAGIANDVTSAASFTNCTIAGNKATIAGGGVYNNASVPVLKNCIVYGNTAASGSAFNNTAATVTYSDAEGGYTGTGNTNTNPLFVNQLAAALSTAGDYRLISCSPVINAGNNTGVTSNDLDGNPRISNTTVDMGAYERQLPLPDATGIVYVDATKNGNGKTWATAVPELADALKAAKTNTAITQIWVAKGTYYPLYDAATLGCNPAENRNKSFVLVNNVKVYGGFAGGETTITGRDFITNETILSGDIGVANDNTDNCSHVVISAGAVGTASLDGFTITNGNYGPGGSIPVNGQLVSPSLGGGMNNTSSSPALNNCKISGNSSSYGGGIYNDSSSPSVTNCIISDNNSSYGGGIYNNSSSPSVTNCLFSGNYAGFSGGGIFNNSISLPIIVSSTITANRSVDGGGIYNSSSAAIIMKNSIVWGNAAFSFNSITPGSSVSYSTIEGGYSGVGNITTNPLFLNPQSGYTAPTTLGDYHLHPCSPAVNKGDNTSVPGGIITDLDGNPRIVTTTVDMGAYEVQSGAAIAVVPAANVVYVDSTKYGDGSSWANPLHYLADALKAAKTNAAIQQIWVKKGTYYPLYDAATLACSPADSRDKSFVLVNNVKVYGGFAGGENTIAGRNFVTNETVLSGDIGVANNVTDNCYHVLINAGAVGTAELNGLSMVKGNANGTGTIFINATAITRYTGGGIDNGSSSPALTNCSIVGNTASFGGGINYSSSSPILTNCSITGNTSTNDGGGIYYYSSSPTLTNCSITSNTAINYGGGIFYYSSSPTLTNCSITGNAATYGGGICNSASSTALSNCSFFNNTAVTFGGAVYNLASTPSITNCIFSGNAALYGGGICNFNSLSNTITNCIFSGNNTAVGGAGGAIMVYADDAPTINNCIFSGNTARSGGGIAINSSNSLPLITNCTFSGNAAVNLGGGIFCNAGSLSLKNSIVWGNTATSGKGVYSPSLTGINFCLIEGFTGTNIINVDPQFISPQPASAAPTTLGDYRLQACSPAINYGDNSIVTASTDLDANTRIKFTDVDLGAYEVQTQDLTQSTWRGINTNWNDKVNWCGGYIPLATTNVTIPTGVSNYPIISSAANTQNLLLANSTSIKTNSTGSLTINGTYTNSGSIITNNGDWIMAGNATAQIFPGASGTVAAMKNIEIKNPSSITFDKSFSITGTLTPTAGNINVNNAIITLASNAAGTARVAEVKPAASFSYTGTGQFAVERFHPARRAWRLMTSPLYGTGTIFATWQNGGVYTVGKGLLITGNPATGAGGNGLDVSPQMNFSLKTGMPITNIGNTKVPLSNNTGLGADNKGYFIFIRGDRNPVNTNTANSNATTLSGAGKLQYGPQNFTATPTAGAYTLIGNPYASPVNFGMLNKTNLANRFYTWDPKLNAVGGWVVVEKLGPTVPYVTDVPSPGGQDSIIQSSQAVYVQTLATTAASLGFAETHKSTVQNFGMFRPANALQDIPHIKSVLYIKNADSAVLADGNLEVFDDTFNDGVDVADALKFTNINETFSLLRNGQGLAIERKKLNPFTDTVFFKLSKTTTRNYQFDFELNHLPNNGQAAFLEDAFLQNSTALNFSGHTKTDFNISSDAASFNAERFRIVFRPSAVITNVSANAADDNIEIKWTNTSEFDIEKYEVEVSTDGNSFSFMGTKSPVANNQQPATYNFLHLSPVAGIYYYRIKSISHHGAVVFSNTVSVKMISSKPGIVVYPNPVFNDEINLKMNDLPVGKYQYRLFNVAGQVITSGFIEHVQRFSAHTIKPINKLASGMYKLEIRDEKDRAVLLKVLVL